MDYCKRCGQCCRAICVGYSMECFRKHSELSAKFIVKHWKEISQEEALKINPHLQKWIEKRPDDNFYYYTCDHFDNLTNQCNIHDQSPRICNAYPLYGREKVNIDEIFYTPDCGYNRDELKELQK